MADRSVLARLRVDTSQWQAGLAQAKRSVQDLQREVSTSAGKNKQEWTQLGMAAGALGAATALGLAKAANAAADFDREMSNVAAVAGATTQELGQLRQAALDAGRDTAFSASQSAQAIGELTRAGVSTADVLGGALSGALDLAAAGGLDLAQAATIAAQGLNIFDLQGSETVRVADALAAGANKSAADVGSLGDALRQGGLVASQYGLDLETTVGTLSLFADNALIGSDAGTSFKTMLQRLVPQSEEAAGAMAEIGFSAFDANGEFVGLESVAEQLRAGLSDLSDEQRNAALNTIFGADAVRAATVLYEAGSTGVDEYTRAVTDQGAAAEMAAVMLDNLHGDLEELSGSFETLMIDLGENLDGVLRTAVQTATGMVNALGELPEPMQNVALGIGGIVSATGLLGGGFLLAAPRIVETKAAMATLATQMPRTASAMRGVSGFLTGPWGLAIGGATVLLGLFVAQHVEAQNEARRLKDDLNALGGVAESAAEDVAEILGENDTATLDAVGVSLRQIGQAAAEGPESVDRLAESLRSLQVDPETPEVMRGRYAEAAEAVERLADRLRAAASMAEAEAEVALGAADANRTFTDRLNLNAEAAGENVRSLNAVREALATVGETSLPTVTGSLEDARAALAGAGVDTEAFGTGIESYVRLPIEALGETLRGFSDPIGAYTDTLARKEEAERESAQATADATADMEDSWEDYYDEQSVSLDEWMTELEAQATAQAEWATNMQILASRVSQETLDQLARLGPEGAPLVADLVDASDEELARLETVVATQTDSAIGAVESRIQQARTVAATFGQGVVDAMNEKLATGVLSAAEISHAYSEALRLNLNPLLVALGEEEIERALARQAGIAMPALTRNTGGPIPGYGPDQDSVLAYLTPGEYVMRRRAVETYGLDTMAAVNAGRAVIQPLNAGGQVTGDVVGLHPEFMRRLSLWSAAVGSPYHVGSGYRSLEEQAYLYDRWLRGVPGQAQAAPPGRSNHNFGLASDGPHWGGRRPGDFGLTYPMSFEPWHVEPVGARAMRGTAGAYFDLPAVPSHQFPAGAIGTPLTASMTTAYDVARAWLDAQFMFPAMTVPGDPEGGGGGSPAANRALGQQMNRARFGDAHWGAHDNLVSRESSWNHLAQNPTSTAFGLYQFLNSTWATVGGTKTTDPAEQIRLGMAYIAQRYGDPSNAWAFWQANRWYNDGGLVGLANGGIVRPRPGGTPILAAEAGSAEAVIPLDRPLPVVIAGNTTATRSVFPNGFFGRPATTDEQDVQIAENLETLRLEGLTTEERLLEVARAMDELERRGLAYTDEWMELRAEGLDLQEAQRAAAAATADEIERQVEAQREAAREAQRAADAIGDELIRLLEQRDRLQSQAADAVRQHATAVAEAQARAAREINDLIRARSDALFGSFGTLDQRFQVGWGNLTSQYSDELDRRFDLFDEWADSLQQLRDRGLSEDVIAQLGLDDPSKLADVRLFVAATDAELQRLNAALDRNSQQAAHTAQTEADMLLGALGEAIVQVRATLTEALDGLHADLTTRLAEIAEETAQLGMDTGRGYADALTEALASGLPGVIAIAQQYQQALADAEAAAAALAAMGGSSGGGSSSGGAQLGNGAGVSDAGMDFLLGAINGTTSGWATGFGVYDSGGVFPSGTVGVNLSGRDEYVFTAEQLRSLRGPSTSAVQFPSTLTLEVDGHQFTAYVKGAARTAAREDVMQRRSTGVVR